jgi:ring-1,2-phenylacetyl-CoA epoxidase subunit PaaB
MDENSQDARPSVNLNSEVEETEIRHPAKGSGAQLPVWEVFLQAREGQAFTHGGNLLAPNAEMAVLFAREFYGRRNESHRLWVVPREAILELVDPDILHPPAVDRSYRTVQGYTVRDRLRATRSAVLGSAQPD